MRFVFSACLLALLPATLAAGNLRIEEVGLEGYYAQAPNPARVQLQITNPQPQAETLEVIVKLVSHFAQRLKRTDIFTQTVSLGPGEQRRLDVPVLVSWFYLYNVAEHIFLEVELHDTAGHLLGQERQELDYPVYDALVAIVCDQERICHDTQTQITFSGTSEEQTRKGKDLKFVAVRQPPAVWWAYATAQTVVLARRPAGLTPEQRSALEDYLRAGGRLVLLEEEATDPLFLAPYRSGPGSGEPQWVGRGMLIRLPGLRSHLLGGLFVGQALQRLLTRSPRPLRFGNTELGYARKRLATSFTLPSLVWLLGWLGAYILLVGLVNFTVVKRLGRREWGWVTVPAIALVFASVFYAASTTSRPRHFGADEVALYWMDDRSSLAATEIGLRVSAPSRASLTLTVPTEAVFSGEPEPSIFSTFMELVSSAEGPNLGRTVRLGPPREFKLSLLQWSFQDFDFRGTRRLAGTVRRFDDHLRNETGQSFRDAIYLEKGKVYFLGPLAAGAEVDLATARQEPLEQHTGRTFFMAYPSGMSEMEPEERYSGEYRPGKDFQHEWEEWRQLPHQPFRLTELLRGWPADGGRAFDYRSGIFFGLAEEPVAGAELTGVPFMHKNFVLTIVSFGSQK